MCKKFLGAVMLGAALLLSSVSVTAMADDNATTTVPTTEKVCKKEGKKCLKEGKKCLKEGKKCDRQLTEEQKAARKECRDKEGAKCAKVEGQCKKSEGKCLKADGQCKKTEGKCLKADGQCKKADGKRGRHCDKAPKTKCKVKATDNVNATK